MKNSLGNGQFIFIRIVSYIKMEISLKVGKKKSFVRPRQWLNAFWSPKTDGSYPRGALLLLVTDHPISQGGSARALFAKHARTLDIRRISNIQRRGRECQMRLLFSSGNVFRFLSVKRTGSEEWIYSRYGNIFAPTRRPRTTSVLSPSTVIMHYCYNANLT